MQNPQNPHHIQTSHDTQAALRAVLGPGFQAGISESMLQLVVQRPVRH